MTTAVIRRQARSAHREAPRPPRLRRFLQGLALASVAIVAAWGSRVIHDPEFMPIRGVRLVGSFQHLDAAQLEQTIRTAVRGNFIDANVDELRAGAEALPWVAAAEVQRRWPGTLEVRVQEHRPVARWGDDHLLSASGQVFAARLENAGLPRFAGPAGSGVDMVAAHRQMAARLAPLGLGIQRLELSERRAWRATLDNGMELIIGRRDREQRLARFAEVYADALALVAERIRRVDLRYPNGFAVGWHDAPPADMQTHS